ncbi:MAG TPA: GNAT family N-acetyltransferase [Bacteroidia bacterium]|jgi:predicted GNAT family acetyltransferase|nr:GNAT family N-acetyltransferase [Bacteroidia bacterium]
MEVKRRDNETKGAFYIEQDNKEVAVMSYVWAGKDKIIIDSTEVDEVLKGKGAGKLMVTKAVEFARGKGIKIIPLCPFAKSVFEKVKEFNDVLSQ